MSSEPDNPGDKPGRFDSPVPDSWGQPVPDSWASQSWPPQSGSAQPDGSGAPPPWPGPGQDSQQTPPPAGAGQSPGGPNQYQPFYGQYPTDGQHAPNGQHARGGQGGAGSQYAPNGQYAPGGQYPANGQFPPGTQYARGWDGAQYPSGTQYPPGPYGDQWQYFTPPVPRNNRAALAALICGLGQFILGLTLVGNILLAIPAIICGSVALKQIRLRGERGRGMAVAGLVLGILGVAYFLLVLIVIVVGARVTNR
jgi:hypothetical protein